MKYVISAHLILKAHHFFPLTGKAKEKINNPHSCRLVFLSPIMFTKIYSKKSRSGAGLKFYFKEIFTTILLVNNLGCIFC